LLDDDVIATIYGSFQSIPSVKATLFLTMYCVYISILLSNILCATK